MKKTISTTTKNSTFTYLGLKCALLFAYYYLLQAFGLGWKYKFWSYMIVTPIAKYFYFQKEIPSSMFSKVLITSVLLDAVFGFLYFHYFLHWTGFWLIAYVLFVSAWQTFNEYLQYSLFKEPDETYVIKISNNLSDFLNLPVFLITNFYIWVFYTEPADMFTPWSLFYWVAVMLFSEFAFGIIHTLSHTIPSLRKLHMVHHEYRREDLNTFANFYADISDSLLMNIVGFINAIFTVTFSFSSVIFKELAMGLGYTHHKYPTHLMTLGYFFEFEVIDMIMERVRLCNYHNVHHHLLDRNFGTYGFISDEVIFKAIDGIKYCYHSTIRNYHMYNSLLKKLI